MKTLGRYKWILGLVVLAVLIGAGVYLVRGRGDSTAASADGQETAAAFIGDLAESATASGQVSAAREAGLSFAAPGRVVEVPVAVGDSVSSGDLLAKLDTSALERDVASAKYDLAIAEAQLSNLLADPSANELAAAEAAVNSARAKLDDLISGPSAEEIAASEATVKAAQANVWSSSGNLSAVREVSEADIAAAQRELDLALDDQASAHNIWVILAECVTNAEGTHTCSPKEDSDRMDAVTDQVRQANAQVAIKQAQLDALLNPDTNQVASSQAGIAAASAQYDAAAARHEALLAGASAADIAAAEADLASAQASLDKLVAGADQTDMTIYEVRVEQAKTALQEALNALDDASLRAPFDGIITAVHAAPGEQASGLIVEMIAADGLEVILNVDEIDIGKLAIGQPATMTMETWPAVELESAITAIAPQASSAGSGAVSYDVHLSLPPTDLPILVGMTANASLVTANRNGVLLVPNAAVEADRAADTYTVNVVRRDEEGSVEYVPVNVTIGLRDGRYTQITGGLTEGDEVVLGELAAPVLQFGGGPPGRRQ